VKWKLVHAADLHLDSPLRGLERYEGAPADAMRGATRRALGNLVDLCLSEGAELLLLAGDLYDGNWRDFGTGLYFARQMARLAEAGVRIVIVRGNHDAASQITKNLKVQAKELSTRKPESYEIEALNAVVHGQSFANRAVTDDLTEKYPQAIPGAFNIGLLHTSADGREGHEPYAPCSPARLGDKGYDYWALGHVHEREILSKDPWIVFPGNIQGRHARETGPKGASVVEVDGSRVLSVEHRALDVVRWAVCTVDATRAASPDDVVDLARASLRREIDAADGRFLAARVILSGSTRAHAKLIADPEKWRSELRAAANESGVVWVEKIEMKTRPPAVSIVPDDALAELVRAVREIKADPEPLRDEIKDLRQKLPAELKDELGFDDLAPILDEVEELLAGRLG
jgi:DNA repair protein SbcD/Mre11